MPLRRLRCQALICWPFAFLALAQEVHEEPPSATDQVTPEGVAEEIEAGALVTSSALRVFAVHDLRLLRVQLETHHPKPRGDGGPQRVGPFLSVAMGDDVIRVTLERAVRELPVHPTVERVVHEQVG